MNCTTAFQVRGGTIETDKLVITSLLIKQFPALRFISIAVLWSVAKLEEEPPLTTDPLLLKIARLRVLGHQNRAE